MDKQESGNAYDKLLKAPYQLIFIMSVMVAFITFISIFTLYKVGFEQQRKRLSEIVKSESVMINMIIDYQLKMEHEAASSQTFEHAQETVLKKLINAHEKFLGFGQTGEYTLAKLQGDTISFLLSHRHSNVNGVNFVPFKSKLAEPMREALKGESGTIIGLDYRGANVLAAYEPIPAFGWGLVAKIDISEIKAPYIKAGVYGLMGDIVLILIGAFFVKRFTSPLIHEMEKNRRYNRLLFDRSPVGLALTDMTGRMIDINPAYLKILGYEKEELLTKSYWDITPKKYKQDEEEQLDILFKTGCYGPYEKEYIHKDGHFLHVRLSGCLLYTDGQSYIWSSVEDITEEKKNELVLRESALVFEHTHEGIMITDELATITRVNTTFTELTGYEKEEVLGENPRFLQSGKHDGTFYRQMWDTINEKGMWYGEIINKRKDGKYITTLQSINAVKDESGAVMGYVSVFSDISNRKSYEMKLTHMATHDILTTLPNRALFYSNLEEEILLAKRHDYMLGVLYLDLNHFKEINDQIGHDAGDELLIEFSKRALASVREADTVARLGGDEFAIILTGVKNKIDVENIAKKIIQNVAKPLKIKAHDLLPSVSIGISFFPLDAEDGNTLVNCADKAMYVAKQRGDGEYEFYQ